MLGNLRTLVREPMPPSQDIRLVRRCALFAKGEGGFRGRDLYPFCFRSGDGKALASPPSVPAGTDIKTLKDATGNVNGQELYAAAQKPEGQITEVSYMFVRPGADAKPDSSP